MAPGLVLHTATVMGPVAAAHHTEWIKFKLSNTLAPSQRGGQVNSLLYLALLAKANGHQSAPACFVLFCAFGQTF